MKSKEKNKNTVSFTPTEFACSDAIYRELFVDKTIDNTDWECLLTYTVSKEEDDGIESQLLARTRIFNIEYGATATVLSDPKSLELGKEYVKRVLLRNVINIEFNRFKGRQNTFLRKLMLRYLLR